MPKYKEKCKNKNELKHEETELYLSARQLTQLSNNISKTLQILDCSEN
jgi:hypothetical protein